MASDDAPLNRLIDCLNVLLGERKDSLEGREIILHLQSLISLYNNLKLSKEHFKEKELLLSKGSIPLPEQFYTGTHHGYRSIEEITSEINETEKHVMKRLVEFGIDLSKIRELIEEDISECDEDPEELEIFEDLKAIFSGSEEEVFAKIIEKTKNPGKLAYYESY